MIDPISLCAIIVSVISILLHIRKIKSSCCDRKCVDCAMQTDNN